MNAKDTPDGFLSHYLPFRNISSGNILDSLNRTAEGILCGAILLCQSQKTRQTRLHILQALQRRIVIHMVLCRQHRNGRFGVADEQRVVTDAQTDDDVQLRSGSKWRQSAAPARRAYRKTPVPACESRTPWQSAWSLPDGTRCGPGCRVRISAPSADRAARHTPAARHPSFFPVRGSPSERSASGPSGQRSFCSDMRHKTA